MPNKKTPARKTKSTAVKSKRPKTMLSRLSFRTKFLWGAVFALVIFGVSYQLMTQAASSYTAFVGIAGKCLNDNDQVKVNGNTLIQLNTCGSSNAQAWKINSNGTITNASGYCLDVDSGSVTAKTLAVLQPCAAKTTDPAGALQQWKVNPADGTIVHVRSKLCLDDQYSSSAEGNTVWIWACNGTDAQKWTAQTFPARAGGGSSTGGGTSTATPGGQAMPVGNLTGWKQIFADNFTATVPKGAFSDCDHNTNTAYPYCGGLKKYGSYYGNWWAYPNTWPDTAKSGADGNKGAPYGGVYHPEDTVSVNNGAMHIRMYRPKTGKDNHVATVAPIKCMAHKYGRYVERFKVVHADPGFKSAHLFYDGGFEVDYPENDYAQRISAYTHPGEANFTSSAKWTSWHTTAIEWTPGTIKFFMDGKLIGTTTKKVPNIPMSWILQNESSIMGPYAKAGAYAQLDLDWVACYARA
ncbi:MAG: hypothetical protein JWN01_591 [Patescibacteria group bacterium]|nr:hypothetical protein [Patescibacteria group bacterium]